MTPSKIKEVAAVKRRQAAILKVLDGKSLTMTQIEAHFPRLPAGVIRGSVGHMSRQRLVTSTPTTERTRNGNLINAYTISTKGAAEKNPDEPAPFMLAEVWRGFPRVQPVGVATRGNRISR